MLKVLIADDHPLFRDALRQVLRDAEPDAEILEAESLSAARLAAEGNPELDLILLDLSMPGSEGFSGFVSLRHTAPEIPIVIVSAAEEAKTVERAVTYGASGFIPKSAAREMIAQALDAVLSGEIFVPDWLRTTAGPAAGGISAQEKDARLKTLTPAEIGVLDLLTQGKPNKIIAYELDIKETTVKAHISSILRKLGVHSRTQAVLAARELDFTKR